MSDEQVFQDILFLSLFLSAIWIAGYVCKNMRISQMVGQILVGMALGPQGIDFVPLFASEEFIEELAHEAECEAFINGTDLDHEHHIEELVEEIETEINILNYLVMLGHLGVTLLILESGLHINFKTLKAVGGSAFIVAVIGTMVPILLGIGLAVLLGFELYPEGLALGAAMGPTSVGISLQLLHEAHCLDSTFGQTIVTAAFTDDIFSLIILAVMIELAGGELNAGSVLIPFCSSALFLGASFLIALYVVPLFVPQFLESIAKKFSQSFRDIVHLASMFMVLAIYGYLGNLIGSHLLGAFLAGITFSKVPRTHQIWQQNMEVIITWLTALFFAATVAFAVPITDLLKLEAFWKGMLFTLIPGLIGKLVCGLFLKERWVIGWAMVGRGEFGFLVAQTLQGLDFQDTGEKFLSELGTGVAMWALIVSTLIAPIAFGFALTTQLKKTEGLEGEEVKDHEVKKIEMKHSFQRRISKMTSQAGGVWKSNDMPRSKWLIQVGTPYQQGLAGDLMRIMARNNIHVTSFQDEGNLVNTIMTFMVLVADPSDQGFKDQVMRMNTKERETYVKDEFFAFDIGKFIDRLKTDITASINSQDATVKIDRYNSPMDGPHEYGGLKDIAEEEDDKDSVDDEIRSEKAV